jgi:hypothetical protein
LAAALTATEHAPDRFKWLIRRVLTFDLRGEVIEVVIALAMQ